MLENKTDQNNEEHFNIVRLKHIDGYLLIFGYLPPCSPFPTFRNHSWHNSQSPSHGLESTSSSSLGEILLQTKEEAEDQFTFWSHLSGSVSWSPAPKWMAGTGPVWDSSQSLANIVTAGVLQSPYCPAKTYTLVSISLLQSCKTWTINYQQKWDQERVGSFWITSVYGHDSNCCRLLIFVCRSDFL